MTRVWSVWLVVWCWAVVAFGVLLVTAAIPQLDGAVRVLFVLFSGDPASASALDQDAVRFGIGIQGALSIGWGLTILATIGAANAAGASLWRALTGAVLVWFVIDSAISIATGFELNAVSNTVLVIAFLTPVLASGVLKRG